MIKSILVSTDGSPYGDIAAEYAISLSKRLGARLIGLHTLDSRMLDGPLMADISGWLGAQPYAGQLPQFRELLEEKGKAVLTSFADRCEKENIAAETILKTGHPAHVALQEEARAELLIFGQKGEHAQWSGMLGSITERIIRSSNRPSMITPESYRPIDKILCAFDGSDHAGNALHEATELAVGLDVELLILTVTEDDDFETAERTAVDGLKLAQAHGCTCGMRVAGGEARRVILEQAGEQGCDLIVMGAYGHSRIREMILGSVTTHVIAHTTVPVMFVR